MFRILDISDSIANKIAKELHLDNDNREIIAYGLFGIFQTINSILLVVILGLLFNVLWEALIISFTTSILRKYSGGIHASSPFSCVILGTVICIIQAITMVFIMSLNVSFPVVVFLGGITFVWSYFTVYKLAPIDSANKPIRKEEKRIMMKKISIMVLSVYLIIVVGSLTCYLITRWSNLLLVTLCLYSGIVWQTFTLTKIGHIVMQTIDTLFNNLLNYGRRG